MKPGGVVDKADHPAKEHNLACRAGNPPGLFMDADRYGAFSGRGS
jgi:hypothetical protein